MTRKEIIEELTAQFNAITDGGNITKASEALRYAIALIEQESCEDVISRKEILDKYHSCADMLSDEELTGAELVIGWIKEAFPVQFIRKGHRTGAELVIGWIKEAFPVQFIRKGHRNKYNRYIYNIQEVTQVESYVPVVNELENWLDII